MAIPTYDRLFLPLLRFAGDDEEHHVKDAVDILAQYMRLSENERSERLTDRRKSRFYDRVQWAKTYLRKAGLLESTGRGTFKITRRGLAVLNSEPPDIDVHYLKQFPEFQQFLALSRIRKRGDYVLLSEQTPRVLMRATYQNLLTDLSEDLLDCVLSASPAFFERLVVDLLLAMGYGGALGTGQAIGKTGDGGLDGYIQEDKLGLDTIYIQAKRWSRDRPVGRPELQAFVGSLMGAGATRGVFITTSRFTDEAMEYVKSIQNVKLILIDGQQLTQLMIEHDVGVSVEETYVIKRINSAYFDED